MKRVWILFSLTLIISCMSTQNKNAWPLRIKTEGGIIEGFHDTVTGLNLYLGIPYAKPPIGELRWMAPQPAGNWDGIREAKKFGPSAVQTNYWGDMIYRRDGMSEDCLYLNVWTPATGSLKDLPVLVYFYGGGFVAGDGSEPRYDGASMAQKGIVAVTVNYRLNIFGFLAHPELSEQAPYKASGNYGLLDQNAALQWVKKNISAFGGDPEKVTIAGESAGSLSVSVQMASPLSKDLITGAIGESGAAIFPTLPPVSLAEAEQIGIEFTEEAGYSSIADLRALDTEEIFSIYLDSKRFGFPMVIDGYLLPHRLPEIFEADMQAQIPLLLGWNSAENSGMTFMQGLPFTEENYIRKVKEAYPEDYKEVLKLYPAGSAEEIELSATALASDLFISYSSWKWFDLHRKNSSQPVYRYYYVKPRPPKAKQEEKVTSFPELTGAPHSCEIEYCMGNLYLIDVYAWTYEDYKVSKTMQDFFTNFIKTGDPNGNSLPEWPEADPDDMTPPIMIIDVESRIEEAAHDERYLFLDKKFRNAQKME